jgi:hypothetical protein
LKPHPNGQWGIRFKIDGQWRWKYFGPWGTRKGAEARYEAYLSGATVDKPKAPIVKRAKKPRKPHPHFPLFAHANGQGAKKVRGKLHYFGPIDDPQAALKKFVEEKDDLLAGRAPRTPAESATLRELVNRFLTSKQRLVSAGELAARTFEDYRIVCGPSRRR